MSAFTYVEGVGCSDVSLHRHLSSVWLTFEQPTFDNTKPGRGDKRKHNRNEVSTIRFWLGEKR